MQIDSDINESLILENLRALQITNKKPDEMELIGILFKTSNNEVVDLTCNLLKKLMRSGNMQQVDVALLLPGLSSPNVNIVTTVLEYLSRQSSQEQETLEILVSLLDHKDQGVVEQSITILEKAAVASENVENIFAWIQPILQPHLDSQNISSYELVARWCQQSADAFKACSNTGMIEFATEFSPFRDVLLSLTVIELFKDISKTHTGFSFLVQTGVLQKLSSVLFADDVLELVMAATIKFWGLVSFQQPEKLELLDSMGIFKQMTELHSLALKIEVVVAIGNVGSTSQGLLFLSDQSILLNYYLDEVFAFASGDLKLDCLKTLSCLLEHRFAKIII